MPDAAKANSDAKAKIEADKAAAQAAKALADVKAAEAKALAGTISNAEADAKAKAAIAAKDPEDMNARAAADQARAKVDNLKKAYDEKFPDEKKAALDNTMGGKNKATLTGTKASVPNLVKSNAATVNTTPAQNNVNVKSSSTTNLITPPKPPAPPKMPQIKLPTTQIK